MLFFDLKKYFIGYLDPLWSVLLLIAFIVILPIVIVCLVLLQIYRQCVAKLLSIKYGQRFRGLLDGPDVVFGEQSFSSRAMTNFLILLENANDTPNAGSELLQEFSQRLFSLRNETIGQKMLWQLRQEYGFYFWLNQKKPPSVHDYVKHLEQIPISGNCMTRRELCQLIGPISNRACETTSWEFLIGTQPVSHDVGGVKQYPVLFRYHHSIADGVAMLNLFCKYFIDDGASIAEKWLLALNPDETNPTTVKSVITARYLMKTVLAVPRFIIHDIILRKERNCFHNGEPGYDKITSWISEDISEPSLISTIKKVKRLSPGVSFTDIVMTALAMSLRAYCEKQGQEVPASLTLALMRRFARETKEIRLSNRSSPVFQTLPVGALPVAGTFSNCTSIPELLKQIRAVTSHSDIAKASPELLIRYLIGLHIARLLPATIVKRCLARAKFSVGMSNIPAFNTTVTVRGMPLNSAIFWGQHFASNMLVLSLLTINNRLHFGLIADQRIIPSLDELDMILEGTMQELRNMEQVLKHSTPEPATNENLDEITVWL